MKITKRNPLTGKSLTLDLPVTEAQLHAWEEGMVAQRAFPLLTADQREFIISGIAPGEFERTVARPLDPKLFTQSGARLVSEASTVGLEIGDWPNLVKLDDQVFGKDRPIKDETEELQGYIYRELFGGETELHILND